MTGQVWRERKASDIQVGGEHYKDMAIQPAEFCQKNRLNFCESAVIKYVCRHGNKRGAEDVKKAIHFLQLLLEFEYPHHATEERCSDLDTYQDCAADTAVYPVLGHAIVYPALGLAGEAGEVAEKVKKAMRDDGQELTDERRQGIMKELGDVLWYVSEVARQAGFKLSEIAWGNIEKLAERKERGAINGEGDER